MVELFGHVHNMQPDVTRQTSCFESVSECGVNAHATRSSCVRAIDAKLLNEGFSRRLFG